MAFVFLCFQTAQKTFFNLKTQSIMKKLSVFLGLMSLAHLALADVVEPPTGAPVSDLLLVVGVIAIAALLFVRYRRAKHKQ